MTLLIPALLWFAAVSCGLLAGLYFAFSAFVMRALGEIDRAAGIVAMNAINRVILRSTFMPLFFGSTLASLALALIGSFRWGKPGAAAMTVGGTLYILGMFGVTMAFNVPLNTALAGSDPASEAAAATWSAYLIRWTRWNHVRTVASTTATILFIVAIAAR